MSGGSSLTRRAALARLGLGLAAAYVAPTVTGLSMAHASTPSAASEASRASPATKPSPASAATAPTAPSAATRPTAPSAPSAPTQPTGPSEASGPSGPGSCSGDRLPDGGQMSRRDFERAQQAIRRGDVRPLREVLTRVQSRHPGTVIRVGFSGDGRSFRVLTVNRSGAVVSVRVDARTGQITGAQAC